MSEKDNSVPPFSSFEIERQARSSAVWSSNPVFAASCARLRHGLRSLVLRSTQLARGPTAN